MGRLVPYPCVTYTAPYEVTVPAENSPIAGFRSKYSLSRARLASLLEVSKSTIIRWEKSGVYLEGMSKLKLEDLGKLLASDRHWLHATDAEIRAEAYKSPAKKESR
jgi:DNA-binding XRE family transcriptional regulator